MSIFRLLNNEIEDKSFESLGLPYFADVLSKMSDVTLLLSYAPVVLEKDAVIGSKVFHNHNRAQKPLELLSYFSVAVVHF